MDGQLAARIALVLYGNQWLAAGSSDADLRLDADNSTYQYVKSLHAIPPGNRWFAPRISSTDKMLDWFRANGAHKLWLVSRLTTSPDRGDLPPALAAAFANGSRWAILASGKSSTFWVDRWEVVNRGDADRRIWGIEYRGTESSSRLPVSPTISDALGGLRSALESIHAFAAENDLNPWTQWFADALAQSHSERPTPRFHPDIAPEGALPLERQQLLAASVGSWVFGGMGSWNDVGFYGTPNDEARNAKMREVSDVLFSAMTNGFVAAVNSD